MVHVQVLGGSFGSQPSLLLFCDDKRYLFNVGEGTQRFCISHKIKMVKVQQIFFSRLSFSHLGGYPGMFLTLSDIGVRELSLYGPVGLRSILESTDSFAKRPEVNVALNELGTTDDSTASDICFRDHNVSVRGVAVLPTSTSSSEPVRKRSKISTLPTSEPLVPGVSEFVSSDCDRSEVAISYVCRLADLPGKFDVDRARALGLRAGPLFSQLVQGHAVHNDAGECIQPEQVLGPPRPGHAFALIDCPTALYIDGLHATSIASTPLLDCVLHLCSAEVAATPAHQAFIDSFPATVTHVLVNERLNDDMHLLRESASNQLRCHTICPRLFPFPTTNATSDFGDDVPRLRSADPLCKFVFSPSRDVGLQLDSVPPPLDEGAIRSAALETLHASRPKPEDVGAEVAAIEGRATAVVLEVLGTGAAVPSKYRNASGLMLRYMHSADAEGQSLLLDCGESTLGQLARLHCGLRGEQGKRLLSSIQAVWISHKHADHHLGLLSIISLRCRLCPSAPRLMVIAPTSVLAFLRVFARIGSDQLEFDVVDIDRTTSNAADTAGLEALDAFLRERLSLSSLRSVPVHHCHNSFAVVLNFLPSGVTCCGGVGSGATKIVYSGDTRPCDTLVEAGRAADLLIHEATFDDELGQDAVDKKHSTTKEALEVGVRMGAARTLLTHFSQRYPKTAELQSHSHSCIAFDLMRLRLSRDLDELEHKLADINRVLSDVKEDPVV